MSHKQDLSSIGTHCHIKECNRLDFLPIKCTLCLNFYCKEHFSIVAHNCEKYDADDQKRTVSISSEVTFYNCSFEQCAQREMVPVVCDYCKLNYCMKHRMPEVDHKCHVFKKQQEEEQAKNLLIQTKKLESQKEFKFEMKTNVSEKNAPLAAKLLLMKLRQTAQGPAALPEELRFYCFIQYKNEKKPFYMSVKWPMGKGVEFFFEKLNINLTSLGKIRLHLNDELVDTSLNVEEFVKNKSLSPGVVLELK